MPTKKVPLITGEYYHIYNRGVNKNVIFKNKADILRFYQSLQFFNTVSPSINFDSARVQQQKHPEKLVQIHAYALLPNHYHILLEQRVDNGISEFVRRFSTGYTSYFNARHDRSGVLFQGKFKRAHVESDTQYNYLLFYINENHIVHGLQSPLEIAYTSSLHYQKKINSKILPVKTTLYDVSNAKAIAKDIYTRRAEMKNLFEA